MKNIFLMLLISFTTELVSAQEIHKSEWTGVLNIGGAYYKGNVNKLDIRSDANVSHADSVFEYSMFYKIVYGENNYVKSNQEFSGGTKFDWHPKEMISPFFALTGFRNEFNGYDARLSAVVGAKYTFIDEPSADYTLSLAIQYDVEKYSTPKSSTDIKKADKEIIRLSARPKIKQKLSESIYLEHISFFKPLLIDFSNIQVESQTTLSNKLTDFLFLNVIYEFSYESSPPSLDVLKSNSSLIVSLRVKF